MNAIAFPAAGLDLPMLAADAMVDSGVFDSLVEAIGRALESIPTRVVAWLGPELRTPDNSAAPSVSFAGGDLVNGVIFVEANTASYWLLVRASAGERQQAHNPSPPFTGHDPFAQPDHYRPQRPSATASLWPDAAPPNETPPWEGDPWRR